MPLRVIYLLLIVLLTTSCSSSGTLALPCEIVPAHPMANGGYMCVDRNKTVYPGRGGMSHEEWVQACCR